MNTTSKPSIIRSAATYGLYIGLFLILCNLISSLIGGGILMMLVKLVGSIGLLVYGMKRYRDIDNGGYILYGNAFSFGMLTSVFSTILYVAYFLVMIVTNAATIRDQLYVTFQELTDKGLVQEEALSSFSFIVENVEWIIPLIVFVWSMLLGLIYSLIISAAIVRKKPIFEE